MDMILIHNLSWALGLALMVISSSYSIRFLQDHDHKLKIPWDAKLVFLAGLILYLISFFFPIPIVN